ncbi:3-5 exoribonuclease [Babesia ovata]|uniref:3-5 exoribonuclease n=1 Tax=Babesia ovata TaxID=189622 RepID=A0A2H6K9X5_9APIC|nr:3-5 exoribonuclease [Babesia ovata]GBE59788.1 3-5 exoribonuclease [Babesia ovata]
MAARSGAAPLFSNPLGLAQAYELLTSINVIVVRTHGTSDECYARCLDYLRTQMRFMSINDLRATQPNYEMSSTERHRERYVLSINQSETLAIAAEIEASYISAESVSRNILFPDVASAPYVLGTSAKNNFIDEKNVLCIRYVEEGFPQYLDSGLFYQGTVNAGIVIHDTEVETSQELKDLFYEEVRRLYDRYGVSIVHMLCRSSRGFELFSREYLCPLYPWLKYNEREDKLRVDARNELFSNHILNKSTARETIIMYSSMEKLPYFLRELMVHCLVCVLRVLVAGLENEKLPESQIVTRYDNPELLNGLSRKQRTQLCTARTMKIHGDIHLMLNNLPKAIATYTQAKKRCKKAQDELFRSSAGFCLAIALSRLSRIKEQEHHDATAAVTTTGHTSSGAAARSTPRNSPSCGARNDCCPAEKANDEPTTDVANLNSPTAVQQATTRLPLSASGKPSDDAVDPGSLDVPKSRSQRSTPEEPLWDVPPSVPGSPQSYYISDQGDAVTEDERSASKTPTVNGSVSPSPTNIQSIRSKKMTVLSLPADGEQHSAQPREGDSAAPYVDKNAERTVRTFTKAATRWLQLTRVPGRELEVCLPIMMHYLRDNGHHRHLHWIIARMVELADTCLTAVEYTNVLRYVIEVTRGEPYRRKWSFYNFLYEHRRLANGFAVPREMVEDVVRRFGLVTSLPEEAPALTSICSSSHGLPSVCSLNQQSGVSSLQASARTSTPQSHPMENIPSIDHSQSPASGLATGVDDVAGSPIVHRMQHSGTRATRSLHFEPNGMSSTFSADHADATLTAKVASESPDQFAETNHSVVKRSQVGRPPMHSTSNSVLRYHNRQKRSYHSDASGALLDISAIMDPSFTGALPGMYPKFPEPLERSLERITRIVGQPSVCNFWQNEDITTDWRLTHFFSISRAYIDVAMRECDAYGMRLQNAHLSLISFVMAAERFLLHTSRNRPISRCSSASTKQGEEKVKSKEGNAKGESDSGKGEGNKTKADGESKDPGSDAVRNDAYNRDAVCHDFLKYHVDQIVANCRVVGSGGRCSLFDFDHVIFASDVSDALTMPRRGYRRVEMSTTTARIPINLCYADRHLLYILGGHGGSNLVVPHICGMDYVPPRMGSDDVIHVKSNVNVGYSARARHAGSKTDHTFKLRDTRGYRCRCICNFSRWVHSAGSMPSSSRTIESARSETDAPDGTPRKGATGMPVYRSLPSGPRCRVVNEASSKVSKCKLVKIDPVHADLLSPHAASDEPHPREDTKGHEAQARAVDIDMGTVQTVEVRLWNPLPIQFMLEDLSLITVGAPVDVIRRSVSLPPSAKELKVLIRFVTRSKGRVDVVGITFRMLGFLRCNQVFLRVPSQVVRSTVESVTAEPWALQDRTADLVREGHGIMFTVGNVVYRPNVSYQSTRITVPRNVRNNFDHVLCSSARKRGGRHDRTRPPAGAVRTSSIVSHCTQRCESDIYASRFGVRIPASSDASVPQTVRLCYRETCWICCLTRQKGREMVVQDAPQLDLIEGEERLIYVTVHNDSVDVILSNVAVSVLPVLDEPDALCEVMTLRDREYAAMKQRADIAQRASASVRSFTVLADKAVSMRNTIPGLSSINNAESPRSHCSLGSSRASIQPMAQEPAAVLPGTTLYIPILYRAAITASRFHVRVDYEYDEHDGPVRATIYKRINLAVSKGISIGHMGMIVKPRVNFDIVALITTLKQRRLQPTTLGALQMYKHVFDDQEVDVILSVANATDEPFLCLSGGANSAFVALPKAESHWRITARRLLYVEAKRMCPFSFVQLLDHHMALRWSLGEIREGELRISDLTHQKPKHAPGTRAGRRLFSKREYKAAVLRQCTKPALWRMKASGRPLSILRYSRIPEIVHTNLHHLVESKITMDISVTADSPGVVSAQDSLLNESCVTVLEAASFSVKVLARNNGDVPVYNYTTVIVPFLYGTCGQPRGLHWTGALEQLGMERLMPASKAVTRTLAPTTSDAVMTNRIVLPGACLSASAAKCADDNVHVRYTLMHSTVLGTATVKQDSKGGVPTITVRTCGTAAPAVGSIVIAQVARLSTNQVECCIVCLDGKPVSAGLKGVIMSGSIHESKAIDSTVYEWFRPGDFVRARVISTSDAKQLMLSTAHRDLGVIRIPTANEQMIPISWKFFLGAKTGTVESRSSVSHGGQGQPMIVGYRSYPAEHVGPGGWPHDTIAPKRLVGTLASESSFCFGLGSLGRELPSPSPSFSLEEPTSSDEPSVLEDSLPPSDVSLGELWSSDESSLLEESSLDEESLLRFAFLLDESSSDESLLTDDSSLDEVPSLDVESLLLSALSPDELSESDDLSSSDELSESDEVSLDEES